MISTSFLLLTKFLFSIKFLYLIKFFAFNQVVIEFSYIYLFYLILQSYFISFGFMILSPICDLLLVGVMPITFLNKDEKIIFNSSNYWSTQSCVWQSAQFA